MKKPFIIASLLFSSLPAIAQSPGAVEEAFVHRTIWLKIDMPGTQLGVDIYLKGAGLLRNYQSMLSQYPAAYHRGDQATVTKVVFKKDHIEFHLDHGGFCAASSATTLMSSHWSPSTPRRPAVKKSTCAQRSITKPINATAIATDTDSKISYALPPRK